MNRKDLTPERLERLLKRKEKKRKIRKKLRSARKNAKSLAQLPGQFLMQVKLFIYDNQKEWIMSVTLVLTVYLGYLANTELQEKSDQKVEISTRSNQQLYTRILDLATRVNWLAVMTSGFVVYSKISQLFENKKTNIDQETLDSLRTEFHKSKISTDKALAESHNQLQEQKLKTTQVSDELRHKKQELSNLAQSRNSLTQDLKDKNLSNRELKEQIIELKNRLQESNFNSRQYLDDVRKLNEILNQTIEDCNQLKLKRNYLEQNLIVQKESHKNTLSEVSHKIDSKQLQIKKLRSELRNSKTFVEAVRAEQKTLLEELSKVKFYARNQSKNLNETKQNLKSLSNEYTRLKSSYSQLQETVRTSDIQNQRLAKNLERVARESNTKLRQLKTINNRRKFQKNEPSDPKPEESRVFTGFDGQLTPTAEFSSGVRGKMLWEDTLPEQKISLAQKIKNKLFK